jgi:uncharacterized protein YbdZ (MbtH family)
VFRLIATVCLALMLAACAHRLPTPAVSLPTLQLAPAALGHELAVQQRLHFQFGSQQRDLDALLEVDAQEVRLAVQAMGQSGVRLQWDGRELHEQRAAWLPPAVRSARVLDDLQFALWPTDAVRAALPAAWQVSDDGVVRRLSHAGQDWLVLTRLSPQRLQLQNRAEGYQLEIETLDEAQP